MSLADFFTPISTLEFCSGSNFYNSQFGQVVQAYEDTFPDLESSDTKPHLVLIGVEEERGAVNNAGTKKSPNAIRKYFYNLYQGDYGVRIADLGNIQAGATVRDTYVALKTVVEELV